MKKPPDAFFRPARPSVQISRVQLMLNGYGSHNVLAGSGWAFLYNIYFFVQRKMFLSLQFFNAEKMTTTPMTMKIKGKKM
ncbi:MAG: hypothetical protein HUN04_16160 [Desulfobacter sp.]|nr:MAG: hypothetical protein HUN04_16160 [Desulfobacter sp.]